MKAAPVAFTTPRLPRLRWIGWVLLTLLLIRRQGVQAQSVRFAVIGDYGADSTPELDVSVLVRSWNPDFVITVGDNNYETGSAATIDTNIGKYYHDYIYNYSGSYGAGSSTRRFLPSLGNHDWGNTVPNPTGAAPYVAYFDLPGNERYYEFRMDPVHIFAIDSDANEPDGNTNSSTQADWLRVAMGVRPRRGNSCTSITRRTRRGSTARALTCAGLSRRGERPWFSRDTITTMSA